MKLKTAVLALATIAGIININSANAIDYFVLPTPENNPYAFYATIPDALGTNRQAIVMNGVPIAYKYDDFWSYSAKILTEIQAVKNQIYIPTSTFGAYSFSTGTGTIDINVSSVAGGATNVVGNLTFQDPVNLSSNQNVLGWTCSWGGNTQYCANTGGQNAGYTSAASSENGVTTVGNLLTYLQSIDPKWTIPVLYADYNQSVGNNNGASLWLSAKVEIFNNQTGILEAFWQLDRDTNNTWDQQKPTYNFGAITFEGDPSKCDQTSEQWNPLTSEGCAGVTLDGSTYTADHNKGSGKADFLTYADTMDLSKYNPNWIFVVTATVGCTYDVNSVYINPLIGTVGCNGGGGEEFGIMGGVASRTNIPEPTTLALLGLALAGIGFSRRKKA